MSDRILKVLVGALAVLIVAWLGARLIASLGGEAESAEFELASLSEAEIDSVVIVSSEGMVHLVAGEAWTVNGYDATTEAGETLTRALGQSRIGNLVGRNPENHARLGVTDEAGRTVTVYPRGGSPVPFIVGGQTQVLNQSYVRRPDEDEVYTLQGSLVTLVGRGPDDWRDKSILQSAREDIQRLEYDYPDESFALELAPTGWTIEPSGATADPSFVNSTLSQLAGLRAIGFAADSVIPTLGWDSLTAELRVLGPGDFVLGELLFMKREDEQGVGYYVRRAGSPVVYTLSTFSGDQILKREAAYIGEAEDETSG
jgi:hypothetical protein